ncbi:hypothetical protein ACH4YO_39575 [Streptomyces noursei]|uniref:hypothetical protein n=1 Tax=Streptomyces noursei TaxID=1971 RepID=UPI0033FF8CD4
MDDGGQVVEFHSELPLVPEVAVNCGGLSVEGRSLTAPVHCGVRLARAAPGQGFAAAITEAPVEQG